MKLRVDRVRAGFVCQSAGEFGCDPSGSDAADRFIAVLGNVWARDFVRKKTVTLRTGRSYIARPPRR
jgi:hypothetical protein